MCVRMFEQQMVTISMLCTMCDILFLLSCGVHIHVLAQELEQASLLTVDYLTVEKWMECFRSEVKSTPSIISRSLDKLPDDVVCYFCLV